MKKTILAVVVLSALGSRLSAQVVQRPTPADARSTTQVREVSLEEAISLADRSSEIIEIARAGVTRANGQQKVAGSLMRPQADLVAAYGRTLASQFEGFSFGGGPDTNSIRSVCAPNIPNNATAAERQAALDQSKSCVPLGTSSGGGADFSSVGFGAKNQWTAGIQFSQPIYTGGRATGQRRAANASRRVADIELTAQRAQVILDVTQAYYNAVLAGRLAEIAVAALTWNEDVLRQTTKARQVGSSSEFDLLRAQVGRDNQIPVVLQRRRDGTIAMLRLKQLLEIPLDDSIRLSTSIDEAPTPIVAGVLDTGSIATRADTSVAARATVREAAENVTAQEGMLKAARAARLPTLSLVSTYQRLFFPLTTFPVFTDFRENWSIGFNAGINLLSGGRTRGNEMQAQANLNEARARLKQAREFAALDSRVALEQLKEAEATWRASAGTAEQARRARAIDEIRYREGISTQTDLTQSQLLAEQAMVNRAVAARDLAVARMRLALLKDLPISASNSSLSGAAPMGAPNTLLTPPATLPPRTTSTSSTTGSNQQ